MSKGWLKTSPPGQTKSFHHGKMESTSPIRVLEDEDLGISVGNACFNPALIAIDTLLIKKPTVILEIALTNLY